jgi:2',3'-cyclic-nucleotide 2'-phosphodiesterase (5'-nucleotidase family)
LAGDFVNPSVLGTVKVEGKKISGAQMIDCMNSSGVDYVTFGNHEFDIKEGELLERINESNFTWIGSNILHKYPSGKTAHYVQKKGNDSTFLPTALVLEIKNTAGKTVKVGLISSTLPANQQDFVVYQDYLSVPKHLYDSLKSHCDFVVGLTHLSIEMDKTLAATIPDLKLIMGGHEHDNMMVVAGNTKIAKADANAKTAYIHTFTYNVKTKKLKIRSTLKKLDETVSQAPKTTAVAEKWNKKADEAFQKQGFNTKEIITTLKDSLDGRESEIRNHQTNMGTSITKALFDATPNADLAIMNSGSVRLDDALEGTITQYDILRTLPFGGGVLTVNMKGSLLKKVLEAGMSNKGSGGFLQSYNAEFKAGIWYVKGAAIDEAKTYVVSITEFLMTGKEKNLGFLTETNPDITGIIKPEGSDVKKDMRLVWIQELKKK